MVRYTLFVLAVVGSAATALASISTTPALNTAQNVTVIEKN